MKKIFLLPVLALITANSVFAGDIAQRITYSNGTTVFLCDNNGNIDYCSEKDRATSIKLLNNPNISIVEQITIKQPPVEKGFCQTCYKAQRKIQSGANLTNTVLDSARAITNMIGVFW